MPVLGVHKEIKVQRPIASDELNIFYNSVGEAVWQIQYLEHAIVSFVVIKRHKRKPSSVKEAYERLETERKGTLGSLYGRAKDEGIIPDNLKPRFDKLISERNWLIHDSRTMNSEDLYNDEKTCSIINRIESITNESKSLTREILQLLETFMSSEEFDLGEAYRMAKSKLRDLKGA